MIVGRITEDEAVVVLTVFDANGEAYELDCVVDTGFTGYLALSRPVVRRLNLVQMDEEEVSLADGSTTVLALYQVAAEWLDGPRTLTAYAVDGNSLVGMKLLRGCSVSLEVVADGSVLIEEAD